MCFRIKNLKKQKKNLLRVVRVRMIGKVICLGVGALGALAVNLAWSYGRRCFGLEDQIVQVGIVQDGEEQEKDRQEDSVQDEKLEQLQEDKQQDIKLQQQDIAKEEKQLQEDAQQGQLAKKTASDGGCSSEREKVNCPHLCLVDASFVFLLHVQFVLAIVLPYMAGLFFLCKNS